MVANQSVLSETMYLLMPSMFLAKQSQLAYILFFKTVSDDSSSYMIWVHFADRGTVPVHYGSKKLRNMDMFF